MALKTGNISNNKSDYPETFPESSELTITRDNIWTIRVDRRTPEKAGPSWFGGLTQAGVIVFAIVFVSTIMGLILARLR